MAKLNYHGLKITGLRAASGSTCKWAGYDEVFYDTCTGEVWVVSHADCGWSTTYRDRDVIRVCGASRHMTMQEIADAVYKAVELRKAVEAMVADGYTPYEARYLLAGLEVG